MDEALIKQVVEGVLTGYAGKTTGSDLSARPAASEDVRAIPVEASGRHAHLSQEHVEALFGTGYVLKKKKDISQPGQYLCEERVTLVGPKGRLDNVAVLGPVRKETQVEISLTDGKALGINAPVRMSGDLADAADVFLMKGGRLIKAEKAGIVAQNHLHMTPKDAERFQVKNGELVQIAMNTKRPLIFQDVMVRADDHGALGFHMDYDEANACGFETGDTAMLLKSGSPVPSTWQNEERGCVKAEEQVERLEAKLISETDIRKLHQQHVSVIQVKKGCVITPLAQDLAREKRMTIRIGQ